MKNIKSHLRNHFFFYILAPLVIASGVLSYYRFMVDRDYLVSYEGTCDTTTEKCFVGCDNDACTSNYYYSKVIKYAPDLEKECGTDITDCEAASACLPEDRECSVTYCDEKIGGETCSIKGEGSDIQNNNQGSPTTENNSLQNDNTSNTNI